MFRYFITYKDEDKELVLDTDLDPSTIEQHLMDGDIVRINDDLYNFKNIVKIRMRKLEYMVSDSKEGVPITIEEIPEEERHRYLVDSPLDKEI